MIQGSDGTLTAQLCRITIRSHWLLTAKFEWNLDFSLPPPSDSQVPAESVVWYYDPRTKLLRWRRMSEPMTSSARRVKQERGRRLAEALQILAPTAPETAVLSEPLDQGVGLNLLDIHRVAPQSRFNMSLCIMQYRDDDIPGEEFLTHISDEEDPEHAAILQRQKVMRCGIHNFLFPEHFYWRYFDVKM